VVTRISVITATLNRRNLLRRAIDSVVAQTLDGVEHIIVDGGSTDGSLALLAEYPHLRVVSEPDRGVYEAWNKGIRRATGDLVCILNSDDEIPPGAFARARLAYDAQPDLEMISGAAELCYITAEGIIETRITDDPRILALREQDIGPGDPIINGRYFTPGLIARIGWFDERYRLIADRDYLLRVLLAGARNVTVSAPLYRYYAHDGSLTLAGKSVTRQLSIESLTAANNGMSEAATADARAAYARWHAWAVFYMAGFEVRALHVRRAVAVMVDAFGRDPVWPLRLPPIILRHIRERPARRGHIRVGR
jgi:glycosyltransferase involved in cell wall biosynthesis